MKTILFLSSLASLFLLVYFVVDEILSPEYKQYQIAYRERLRGVAGGEVDAGAPPRYPIRIRQIVSRDLQRTDRCISCHVGIEDPRMAGEEQPVRTHPGKLLESHDIRRIGCTICHDGQGRALSERDAHAFEIEGWEKPMLLKPFLYSNCIRCHEEEDYPELSIVRKGQQIFFSRGCLGCHKLNGRGGQLGPDLTNIADASAHLKHPVTTKGKTIAELYHRNPNVGYIFESVMNPKAQPADSAMMDFGFSDDEILALTVFLKGLSRKAVPASYLAKRREARRQENLGGPALYAKYCVACHGKDARGGVKNINYAKRTVPALNTMAEKLFLEFKEDADYLADLLRKGTDVEHMSPPIDLPAARRVLAQYAAVKNVIRNGSPAAKADPSGPSPALHMPSWASGLTEKNIDSIIAYLLTLYPWEDDE